MDGSNSAHIANAAFGNWNGRKLALMGAERFHQHILSFDLPAGCFCSLSDFSQPCTNLYHLENVFGILHFVLQN